MLEVSDSATLFMVSIRAAVLALFALSCAACAPLRPLLEPDHEALAQQLASESVELVQTTDEGDQHVYCSGTWIGVHEILTANHCVDDLALGDEVDISMQPDVSQTPDGEEAFFTHMAELKYVDPEHDLALLYVKPLLAHGVAEVGLERLAPGQAVYAEGAPAGMGWSFSTGVIAQIRYVGDGDKALWYVQATAPISPGSSGGGLFDSKGDLIGVTRAYVVRGQNLNLFVHRDHIVAFLINAHASKVQL